MGTMFDDIEAVIFDLDGTLVDSMWIWREIDIEYLGRRNIEMPKDLQRKIEGMSFVETAVYFKENFKLAESLEEIMNTWNLMAKEKYENEVPLKDNIREFLQKLKNRGIRMGIATSNSRLLTEAVLLRRGIFEFFDAIATGCEVKAGKPAPDIYLDAADKLSVQPAKCLVFEDLPFGIMAGHNAGMKVCAIEDEYSAEFREDKRRLADYYISSYADILEEV